MTIDPVQGSSPVGEALVLLCTFKGHAGAFVVVNRGAPLLRPFLGVVDS